MIIKIIDHTNEATVKKLIKANDSLQFNLSSIDSVLNVVFLSLLSSKSQAIESPRK